MPLVLSGSNGISSNGSNWAFNTNTSGHPLTPSVPRFRARGYSGVYNTVYQTWTQLDFNNGGGTWTASTGAWTVPVSGAYFISFGSGYKNAVNYLGYGLSHNQNRIWYSWTGNDGAANHDCNSGGFVLEMVAGDYVQVRIESGYTTPNSSLDYTFFSGFLIG